MIISRSVFWMWILCLSWPFWGWSQFVNWDKVYPLSPVQAHPTIAWPTLPFNPVQWQTPDSIFMTIRAHRESGALHRPLDAGAQTVTTLAFRGRRHLSSNQLLLFKIHYSNWNQHGINQAIELEPYADDPLMLQDTTSGNFQHSWLQFATQYFHRFNSFGTPFLGLYYLVGQGLKDKYTRPRILRRAFRWQAGFLLHLTKSILGTIGFQSFYGQDQTEIEKSRIDFQDPVVYRYRSADVFRPFIGEFTRYVTLTRYSGWLSLYRSRWGKLSLTAMHETMNTIDRTSLEFPDTPWYRRGVIVQLASASWTLKPPLRLKLSATGGFRSGWSQHPDFPLLIMERTVRWSQLQSVIAVKTPFFRVPHIILKGYWYALTDNARHYQRRIFESGKIQQWYFALASRLSINRIQRFGGEIAYFNAYQTQTVFRFFPEFQGMKFQLHFQENRAAYNWLARLTVHYFQAKKGSPYRWRVLLHVTLGFQLPQNRS